MYILDKHIGRYKNTYDTSVDRVLTLDDYFYDIKNSSCRAVSKYRYAIKVYGKNSNEAKELKMKIPAVTTSGVFNERKDNDLKSEFTNVIVLDLDAQDNEDLNLSEAVIKMREIPYTLAVHKSCSGRGLAVYVLVEEWKSNTYKFTRMLYELHTNLIFDNATSNLSRLRYVSNDPNIYINHNVFTLSIPDEKPIERKVFHSSRMADGDATLNGIVKWWRYKFPMVSGKRNHNAYILARQLNKYGVSKNECFDVLNKYCDDDFTIEEVRALVESAYSNISDFNSLKFR